jgi:rhodanese-related sulfurtransferase
MIAGRKEGLYVYYRLAGDEVVALMGALGAAGEAHLAEVERIVRLYFASKDALEAVPARELVDRARKGLVTVLDVRPPEEFAAGHVPGAVNIPVHELARRLAELPKSREVVAYCRGPYCLLSYDAVALLRQKGLKARARGRHARVALAGCLSLAVEPSWVRAVTLRPLKRCVTVRANVDSSDP